MLKAKGQMSIFFGIMIMIILSLTALVINVGLFVKAKINLQNAVDAAAWSGAAVQSRQMTNIAYINWEMRNVYKEWMFKYYVLGNIGLRKLNGPNVAPLNGGQVSNFTMNSFALNGNAPNPNADNRGKLDQYNIPSICVQFDNTTNDCDLYKLPPLPRFETSTQPGIAVTTDVFVDELSGIRSKGCADKSKVNFEVAAMWAYAIAGVDNDLSQNAPELLSNRSGAFTKAFELGVRIRNLESLVNFPAADRGICASAADAAGSCGENISALAAQDSPHLERTVKAFYSAYRNLGNDVDSEMKASFTMTELAPQTETFATTSLSGMLYPGTNVRKQYIDLRLMPVNFATFYTSFVTPPSSSNSGLIDDGITSNASFTGGCDATKVALPVPGYPLGYVKNPNMLTHYAVKGEANFVGLFNPFSGDFTKLTAYSAAKPFGGRIGPALFNTRDNTIVTARGGNLDGDISRHYAAAFNLENSTFYFFNEQGQVQEVTDNRSFVLGAPVPIRDFWATDTNQALGGDPTNSSANAQIRFTIPNLVWSAEGSLSPRQPLTTVTPGQDENTEPIGLYSFAEFNQFKSALDQNANQITPAMMEQAVVNLRAPTDYEAYNYLIPSPATVNAELGSDSFGQLAVQQDDEGNYNGEIYAPLYEQRGQFPYNSIDSFRTSFSEYLNKQSTAVEMYLRTMKEVADSVRDAGNSSNFATNYEQAAIQFSDATDADGIAGLTCNSIAGTFYYYYLGTDAQMDNTDGCPDPFSESFVQFWSGGNPQAVSNVRSHRVERFNYFQDDDARFYFTGYAPGPRQGADRNGVVQHPVFSQQQNMIRNFYSTKFISLRSATRTGGNTTFSESGGGLPIFSQGRKTPSPSEMRQNGGIQQNTIETNQIHHNLNQYIK